MRRLLAIAMALCLLPLGTTTALGATTVVDCRNGADLQAAIDGASSGDTLRLKGTCRGNFTIIGKDLMLRGAPRATLHAGGRNAALRVNHDGVSWYELGGTVTLRGLTITGSGGDAYWADGVHAWSAEVILRDCTVKGNKGNGLGGLTTYRLDGSTVRGNAKSGIAADGDGMNVYLDDSRISGNGRNGVEAIDLFMKRSVIAKNGGNGVSMTTQGHVEAEDSRFLNNGGRGISSQGMNLSRVIVSGNDAGGIVGGFDNFLWVTIDQSTIRNNRVSGDGGGLVCFGGCRVTDSRIVGNTATGDGGGVYLDNLLGDGGRPVLTLRESVVANNRAGGSGGGIYNSTSLDVVLNGAVLRNNRPNDCTGC